MPRRPTRGPRQGAVRAGCRGLRVWRRPARIQLTAPRQHLTRCVTTFADVSLLLLRLLLLGDAFHLGGLAGNADVRAGGLAGFAAAAGAAAIRPAQTLQVESAIVVDVDRSGRAGA